MNWESQKPKAIGTYWHADPNWNRGVVKMLVMGKSVSTPEAAVKLDRQD